MEKESEITNRGGIHPGLGVRTVRKTGGLVRVARRSSAVVKF